MAKRTRRDFLQASAVAAAALVVGCDDSSSSAAQTADVAPKPRPDGGAGNDAASDTDGAAQDAEPDVAPPDPDAAAADGAPDVADPDAADPDAADDPDAAVDPDGSAADSAAEPDAAPLDDLTPAAAERLPESQAFPQGIASGDVLPTAAILWARYAGDAALEVAVWETHADGERLHDRARVDPADGGFAHYDVQGLTPGAWYRYAFLTDDDGDLARSDFGTFRAAIADDALEAVVFGAGSCTRNGGRFPALLRVGDAQPLDLYLLLGDTTYADGARTREQYRGKWAENLETAAYQRLRSRTSVTATWDDHEVDNNWDPEEIGADHLTAAREAFFEHLPTRRDPLAPDRIWRSFRWGRTAEFFVLDCRGERLPSTRDDDDAQYISPAQMDWLQTGLRESDAAFKIIVNSVPMGDFPTFGIDDDRWSGYAAQREALLVFLDVEAIPGVFVISGDFHLASMGRLTADGPGSDVPEFLVGPGEQFPNPLALLLPGAPNIDWSIAVNNHATFALDPMTSEVDVVYYDSAGRVLVERTWALGQPG